MSILIISFWSNLAPRSEVRANSSRIVFNVAKDWAATFTSPMICQDIVKTLSRHCQDIVKTCQGGDNLKQFREQFLSHFQFDQFDQFATLQWFFLEFSIISMQFCAHHCMSLILHVSHLHFPIYPNLPQLSQQVQHGSTFPQRSPTFPHGPYGPTTSHLPQVTARSTSRVQCLQVPLQPAPHSPMAFQRWAGDYRET